MLNSPMLKTSSSERTLLKNLGAFLGRLTIAKNRPVLQVRQTTFVSYSRRELLSAATGCLTSSGSLERSRGGRVAGGRGWLQGKPTPCLDSCSARLMRAIGPQACTARRPRAVHYTRAPPGSP